MVPRMALAMTVTTDPAPPRPVTFDWDELNRLVRWVHQFAAAARGLIVVGGDKGGVGKTTVAYELAGPPRAPLVDPPLTHPAPPPNITPPPHPPPPPPPTPPPPPHPP